jgi:SAM-dependent methyltransferase
MAYRYLLGDSKREAARLGVQAKLWDPVSRALFDRLGIARGSSVLEIGPGAGSLYRELCRRTGGRVDAVERSPLFADGIARIAARAGGVPGTIHRGDLRGAELPRSRYDVVFARWVFLFLPDPVAHLRKLARALKPGGRIALQEYHRETFTLVPRPEGWQDFLDADQAFFRSEGGDASLGSSLPALYREAGLEVVEVRPEIKVGGPGSPVWEWVTTYFMGVMDRLATHPPFDREKARRLRSAWRAAERRKTSLMIAPAVLDVVGRRPR